MLVHKLFLDLGRTPFYKSDFMKATTQKTPYPLSVAEKRSAKLLMEKMRISKKELKEISSVYGVSFTRIVELMQLSKYEFMVKEEIEGLCEPCKIGPQRLSLKKVS